MKSVGKLVRELKNWKRRQSLASRKVYQVQQRINRVLKSRYKVANETAN